MAWTAEQRAELRQAYEQSRRDALAESERLASVKPLARVEPPLRPEVVAIPSPPAPPQELRRAKRGISHCIFCGNPTRNWSDVCRAHSDLLEATG